MKKINKRPINSKHTSGFTILELVVVIVIIAILAVLTIASYIGTQASARDASVQSDLDRMDAIQTNYGVNTMKNAVSGKDWYSGDGYNSDLAFTPSSGNVIDVVTNSTDYCIRGYNSNGTKNSIWNAYTKESTPGVCDNQLSPSVAAAGSTCPTGYIRVPGSSTYGTNDFCVMKYEAKNVGGVATSQAASTPWVSISQTNSIATSKAACPGCRLISDARWLTIAQNLLNVTTNWSSGTVGTGYIYSGHNDNAPPNALVADSSDLNGYSGETNTGGNQRRTLTLSNGQVIWDLAGNVWEWTSGQTTGGEPGVNGSGYAYREWTAITNNGKVTPNPAPSGTGISGAGSWTTGNGIGWIYSSSDETSLRGFLRGGKWSYPEDSGVLSVHMSDDPVSFIGNSVGFRVCR